MKNFNKELRLTLADVSFMASYAVYNHQKYYRMFPTFDTIDRIILNIADGIKDPKVRSVVRQYRCSGISKTKHNHCMVHLEKS